jgi:uncharacterized protein with GYD domain
MPKYLFRGRYSQSGAAGVMKEGGSGRTKAAAQLIESAGGTLEALYWTFGEDDFIVIADMPDQAAAAAVSLTVGASGAIHVTTTPLLTASDVDEMASRSADYRPPGQ